MPLGGHDPYSASKACAELVVAAFRRSFLTERPAVATARAGNVIGGGDWSADRIIADAVRAFAAGQPLAVRSPEAIRPWQHVTQPLLGYLTLARALHDSGSEFALGYNFGPSANRSLAVREVVEQAVSAWGDGASWQDRSDPDTPHEAGTLELDSTRAGQMLDWRPLDDITRSIEATVEWYRAFYRHEAVEDMRELTRRQIRELASLPLS